LHQFMRSVFHSNFKNVLNKTKSSLKMTIYIIKKEKVVDVRCSGQDYPFPVASQNHEKGEQK